MEPETRLDEVTVTATREAQSMQESSHSVGVITQDKIDEVKPAHPSEIMERVPGVHVNVTGGEGHMTAIRQPLTTKPLYIYLEDGIPSRSTGFFNHNALYEINVPQSSRIEVLKGPGSALYGSDAIGAVVNAQTRPAPLQPETELGLEAGEHGFRRLLLTGGNTVADDGYRADLNLTHTSGWREATEYDRQSATGRWDRTLQSGATLKTVAAYSNIDQQTAGSSRLLADDYYTNPVENYTPVSLRQVEAKRISVAYEKETNHSLLSITPYLRDNSMTLLPNWSLGYDPTIYTTENVSGGLQARYRMDFAPMRTRLIAGVDIDHSPGSRFEQSINATKDGRVYTAYSTLTTLYDYDVTYTGISPYLHLEFSPATATRITMGLRYDEMEYDFDNHIDSATVSVSPSHLTRTLTYNQISDSKVSFSRLSPKLGLAHTFSKTLNGFVSYRQAFRAPSEGQIFRPGSTVDTINLRPVKADSIETGLRGKAGQLAYNVSLYSMRLEDDILSYDNPDTGDRETLNAGETLHEGIELGLDTPLTERLELSIATSYAKHSYEQWQPKATVNYSGNEIENAPRLISNVRFAYRAGVLNDGKLDHSEGLRGFMKETKITRNWQTPVYTLDSWQGEIYSIVGYPDEPRRFSLGTCLGLFTTNDHGQSWLREKLLNNKALFIWSLHRQEDEIFIGALGGPNLFKPDNSSVWQAVKGSGHMPTSMIWLNDLFAILACLLVQTGLIRWWHKKWI